MQRNTVRTLFLALSIAFCGSSYAQKDEALLKAVEGRKAAAPKQQRPDPRRAQQQRQNQPRQNLSFGHAVPPFLYAK